MPMYGKASWGSKGGLGEWEREVKGGGGSSFMGFFMFQLARYMRYDMILMICREFSLKLVYGRVCVYIFFFFWFVRWFVYVYCTQFRFRNSPS